MYKEYKIFMKNPGGLSENQIAIFCVGHDISEQDIYTI